MKATPRAWACNGCDQHGHSDSGFLHSSSPRNSTSYSTHNTRSTRQFPSSWKRRILNLIHAFFKLEINMSSILKNEAIQPKNDTKLAICLFVIYGLLWMGAASSFRFVQSANNDLLGFFLICIFFITLIFDTRKGFVAACLTAGAGVSLSYCLI